MTLGDARGAGIAAEPNANTSKPNGGGSKANQAKKLRVPSPADGTTAASAVAAVVTSQFEGAVSLRTVGKTVAFLAKLAAPAAGEQEGDGGVFGGGGKMAGAGGTGSAYG